MLKSILLCVVLSSSLSIAVAADTRPLRDPTEDALMISAGFLAAHPDLQNRQRGVEAYETGRFEEALKYFRRAAHYADKASQAMVGEMLWNGEGVARDPALAYVWMDLAAERGYRGFLQFREQYWAALGESERKRALDEGRAIYARYGDAAAKPRIAAVLRRGLAQTTGSRLGSVGALQIMVPGPGGVPITIDGSKYYDPRYWDPKQYAEWHDRVWMNPRVGRVDVGETETLRGEAAEIPAMIPDADSPGSPVPPVDSPR
ncbi:tetratricopeptide repeat protein [Lysobacter sp. A286]